MAAHSAHSCVCLKYVYIVVVLYMAAHSAHKAAPSAHRWPNLCALFAAL